MEKNKLYKVNKWNKPAFERENVFDGFNYPSQQMQIAPSFTLDYNKINQRLGALGANVNNSLAQNSGIKGASTGSGGIGNMLYGTAAALGRSIGANDQFKRGMYDRLDPLFYLADGKESTIGNALSDVGVSLFETGASTGNAPLMIAGGIGKGVGSLWNAAAGIKWNNDLINDIKANTQQAQAVGNAFGNVDTSQAFFNTSGNMVNGIDFDWDDLGSTGFLRSNDSLKSEANSLKGKQKTALAYQLKGMGDAAERVDSMKDANVFGTYAALGGHIPTIGAGTEDMPAINFGMWQDWLTGLNKRRKQASDNREANDYTNIGMGMRYDFGGDMQTNSADFPTGLTHVNAGGTHEESPYDGVQMGVDPEGTPNLVEEGEAIWNDYVFSNRIELDEEAKKIFHFPKKTKLTYADAAKRLEKEISERPNDPISKAGFKVQMQQLEEQQERQKQEMEAERAKAAFEALSPEEQVAVMQNAAQQEQMAQEQAMAAEQANMPGTEPMMAEGQAGVPSQEEMAMMQQQGQPEVVEGEPVMAAYGGNLFDEGGYKGALAWLNKNQPNLKNKEAIARVMAKRAKVVAYRGSDENNKVYNFEDVFKGLSASTHRRIGDSNDELFRSLVNDGMPRELAFEYAYPETLGYPYNGAKYASEHAAARDAAYQRMMTSPQQAVSAAMPSSNRSIFTSASDLLNDAVAKAAAQQQATPVAQTSSRIPTETPAEFWSRFNALKTDVAQAAAARKAAAQSAPVVETATVESGAAPAARRRATRTTEPVVATERVIPELTPYDWYRNGSDGYSTPTGFKVGDNGLIKQEDYTQEYRDLVDKLTANDIRQWAAQHPQDPSLLSFLAKGNKLEDLTDAQWRKGATDGKYGFMHHVSDQILQDRNNPKPDILDELGVSKEDLDKSIMDSVAAVESQINGPRVFHALEGDDDYIQGELDPAVVGAETRRETLPNGDTVIYHGKPTGNVADTAGNDNDKKIVPNLRPTWMRYAGLLGPAVGLGLMAAGVGRPDTSVFDSVLEGYDRRGIGQMEPRYIGNYLRYSPMDIWFEQNRLNANSRATDRSIANSGANQGSKIAGMLANAYNNQIASGDLYRKALEYNDAKRHQVADFNRATDMFNAQAYNQAQQFNASARNADRGLRAQLGMQAAAQKADMDAGWYNSLYGNIGALTRGIADIGRENYNHNMLARLAASGALPGIVPGNNMDDDLVRYGAHGGKLKKKKKRGLTC